MFNDRCTKILSGSPATQSVLPTDHLMHQIWLASYLYPTLAAAHELGVLGKLTLSPKTPGELASELKISQRAALIMTDLLADLGFLEKNQETGVLSFTLQGRTYLSTGSQYSWEGMFKREHHNPTFQQIVAAARAETGQDTGALSFLLTNTWSHNSLTQEQAKGVTASMHSESAATARIQAEAFDPKEARRLLDIGGGSGVFSTAFAEKHPNIECTLADLEPVIASAEKYVRTSPSSSRIKTISMDMFRDPWPQDHDVIFMSNILHDWDPPTIRFLLTQAHKSLPEKGRILINEMLAQGQPSFDASAFSVVMLTRTRGKQLSPSELRDYLEEAGFRNIEIIQTPSAFQLISAEKAP